MNRKDLKYCPLYRSWYQLAHLRDTDEKRLAFYDAIFDYAFNGTIPPDPLTEFLEGMAKGVDYARRDAYLTVHESLDAKLEQIINGTLGGQETGNPKARFGNQNAAKKTQTKRKQNA